MINLLRFTLLPFCFLLVTLGANGQGITFIEDDLGAALKAGQAQNKPIIVDCYTTWCGPCKRMSSDVFTRADVGTYFNSNYISAKIDMEAGNGPKVAQAYRIASYPSFIVLNGAGELMYKFVGARSPEDFIHQGMIGKGFKHSYVANTQAYGQGYKDTAMLKELAIQSANIDKRISGVALQDYFLFQPKSNWISQANFQLFADYAPSLDHPYTRYLVANKPEFIKAFGEEVINQTLVDKGYATVVDASELGDSATFSAFGQVHAVHIDGLTSLAGDLAAQYYFNTNEDPALRAQKINLYVKTYASKEHGTLNTLAWRLMQLGQDQATLALAEGIAQQSLSIDKNAYNTHTLGTIYLSQKKLDKAKDMAQLSAKLAQKSGLEAGPSQDLLAKIAQAEASSK